VARRYRVNAADCLPAAKTCQSEIGGLLLFLPLCGTGCDYAATGRETVPAGGSILFALTIQRRLAQRGRTTCRAPISEWVSLVSRGCVVVWKAANVALGNGERGAEAPLCPMSRAFADLDLRDSGNLRNCWIATYRFTASVFPPRRRRCSIFQQAYTPAAPWNERSTRELKLWYPNNLVDNTALHEGANERICLEPL
jgi:hypothetical protein